ncbi:MAG: Methionine transporter substrate-binding protein [Firmicutes bacterium]|nr:Methionine transporter substrate-binding protein [Bacillota bacterium]
MKKFLALTLSLVFCIALLAGCGTKTPPAEPETATTVIKVAATPAPHAEILEVAKSILAEEGIDLQIVEFTDYIQPNLATESGDVDANYFQHIDYLNSFNPSNNTHLVNAAEIHYEPYGLYPGKTATIEELADGAQIAVPNDPSNEARALLLLEAQGIIKLAEGVGLAATALDIVENPKNVEIVEMEAASLPGALSSVDMAVINGNYAIGAGLSVANDSVAVEDADSAAAAQYANIIVVKEGNENNEAVQALIKALKSDTVRDFINNTYDGAVVPLF